MASVMVEDAAAESSGLHFTDEDLPFEEDLLRNPFSLRCWLRYVEHKKQTSSNYFAIYNVYERGLRELPGSYKLWQQYLTFRMTRTMRKCITDPEYDALNQCFRRALVFMNKMPRIWIMFCSILVRQRLVTQTRRTFDDALRSLPATQHNRIWPLYLKFLGLHSITETTVRVYRRYLKFAPEDAELYVEYLKSIDRLDEAAQYLAQIVNDDNFVSREEKTNHQLWHELCELVAKNPSKVTSFKVEPIILQGISRYSDQVGALWCALADYYIRDGQFERARDIYEQAMQNVITVRDFTQIFDAYAQFMERLIAVEIETENTSSGKDASNVRVDLLMARFEDLMDRRSLLVNSVLLRQNPHNVHEWLKRVELTKDNEAKTLEVFEDAVKTVNPKLQVGKLSDIWTSYARYYERCNRIEKARQVFEEAVQVQFAKVEELSVVYCSWAEMELRQKNWKQAIKVLKRCLLSSSSKVHYFDQSEPVQNRVHKSLRAWSMYADLEENFGTFESCKAVYEKILDLRIATPQLVINYAAFLEENKHFEESFKAFEKGVALFPWPNVGAIWHTYLIKFLRRYAGTKLERIRDLFEQCLESCPAEYAAKLYLLYAKVEEDYGLGRNAMALYERAAEAVPNDQKNDVFKIYIKRTCDLYGITNTRPIYERAIESLPENEAREMCLRFANLERKLGEIDRARAIFAYCSQLCNPKVHSGFWELWKEFEVKHGNEDTVREMLRIKRSVMASTNTDVNFMSAQMLAGTVPFIRAPDEATGANSMAVLEAQAQVLTEEITKSDAVGGKKFSSISFIRGEPSTAEKSASVNPDEIDIEGEAEEASENTVLLEKLSVPSEVFGNLAPDDD